MGSRVYAGRTASTRTERVVYCVPVRRAVRRRRVARRRRARRQADAKKLQDGTLNRVRCPSCEARAEVQVPVVFHDGARERLVLVLPEGCATASCTSAPRCSPRSPTTAWRRRRTCSSREVVFGAAGLRALLAPPPSDAAFDATSEPGGGGAGERTGEQPALALVEDDKPADKPQLALLPSLQDDETPLPQPPWGPTRVDARAPEASV